jgi:hypothetical protein
MIYRESIGFIFQVKQSKSVLCEKANTMTWHTFCITLAVNVFSSYCSTVGLCSECSPTINQGDRNPRENFYLKFLCRLLVNLKTLILACVHKQISEKYINVFHIAWPCYVFIYYIFHRNGYKYINSPFRPISVRITYLLTHGAEPF